MALIGCSVLVLLCVCFFKKRVNAILIGCRCYKNAQAPLQEQINETGVFERAKGKAFPQPRSLLCGGDLLSALGK